MSGQPLFALADPDPDGAGLGVELDVDPAGWDDVGVPAGLDAVVEDPGGVEPGADGEPAAAGVLVAAGAVAGLTAGGWLAVGAPGFAGGSAPADFTGGKFPLTLPTGRPLTEIPRR